MAPPGSAGNAPAAAGAPPAARAPAPAPAGPGSPQTVPPAWLPLSYLAAAAAGLVGLGVALALAASQVVATPQAPEAVATAHLAMLAFLTTAVLGAAHQFGPVVAGRALRSTKAGLVTLVLFVPAAWLLPLAFATSRPGLLEGAGLTAFTAICIAAWNLSGPLLVRGHGTPVLGLRLAVGYLVVTAAFGSTYAFDRHHGWFVLLPRRVLAHAHLGLLGWLGLAYVAVAEKLWPMFLLAHRPSVRAGRWAVRLLAVGVPLLAAGLLVPSGPLCAAGALLSLAGLGSHLLSLGSVIRHRRRRLELLHGFVLASAVLLVVATAAGIAAGTLALSPSGRLQAVQTEVLALTLWLGLAVVGHAHKIVPFITWSRLRASGHTSAPDGSPLLFAHLVHQPTARATFGAAVLGAAATTLGVATATPALVRAGGVALAATGLLVVANLTLGPIRVLRAGHTGWSGATRAPSGPAPRVAPGAP